MESRMTLTSSLRFRYHISVIGDNPLATETLKNVLRDRTNWHIEVYSLSSYMSTLNAPKDEKVLIVDKGGTTHCFAAHFRNIRHCRPSAKLIAIDHPLSTDDECLLLYLGVHGFVAYSNVHRQLKTAVQAVQRDQLWFSPQRIHQYVEYLTRRVRGQRKSLGSQLTLREQEIIRLIQRGLFTSQIGVELSISGSTVKFHVGHILAKLGLKHRREILSLRTQDASGPTPAVSGSPATDGL